MTSPVRDRPTFVAAKETGGKTSTYAYFALAVLVAANMLNFLDRYILSILAQSIKSDLAISDAQLGFLLGTAFAVFYAIIGIAMGRIADAVRRPRLMAVGLGLWSAMTAIGGLAPNFATLSVARIGVGVGEATATPCSHSLISEYFPARNRAFALGIYILGASVGSALALILGGLIVQNWPHMCRSVPVNGACDMAGWRAAMIFVGLPGIPLALLVASLREPVRLPVRQVSLVRLVMREMGASLPPFSLFVLYAAGGMKEVRGNIVLIAALTVMVVVFTHLMGDLPQWLATALGIYVIITWTRIQKHRDLPFFKLTFGCPVFTLATIGSAFAACIAAAVSTWAAPYAMRTLVMSPIQAGVALGLTFAGMAAVGAIVGGAITDRWKRRAARAPIWMVLVSICVMLPSLFSMLATDSSRTFVISFGVFSLFSSIWGGAFAALAQDLVLTRMRGAASSAFALVTVVVSAGAGPYWVGKVSAVTGSLGTGLLSIALLAPFAFAVLLLAARRLPADIAADRVARARAAGEVI